MTMDICALNSVESLRLIPIQPCDVIFFVYYCQLSAEKLREGKKERQTGRKIERGGKKRRGRKTKVKNRERRKQCRRRVVFKGCLSCFKPLKGVLMIR